MILPKFQDAFHKAQLLRLLIEMLDNQQVSQNVYFKGGTCAALLGYIDRFSVDLDFDLKKKADKKIIDGHLRKIFGKLNLKVDKKSKNSLYYLLKYKSESNLRNSLK